MRADQVRVSQESRGTLPQTSVHDADKARKRCPATPFWKRLGMHQVASVAMVTMFVLPVAAFAQRSTNLALVDPATTPIPVAPISVVEYMVVGVTSTTTSGRIRFGDAQGSPPATRCVSRNSARARGWPPCPTASWSMPFRWPRLPRGPMSPTSPLPRRRLRDSSPIRPTTPASRVSQGHSCEPSQALAARDSPPAVTIPAPSPASMHLAGSCSVRASSRSPVPGPWKCRRCNHDRHSRSVVRVMPSLREAAPRGAACATPGRTAGCSQGLAESPIRDAILPGADSEAIRGISWRS